MKTIFVTCLLLFTYNFLQAQNNELPTLIKGAIIHIGNGEVIQNGDIIIKDGKIAEIGEAGKIPLNKITHNIIDAKGKHVYPSFINVDNTLGLREIDAVRATRDFEETGTLNPHIRAMIAFNTDSRVSKTVRTNGVLITQATPRGGRISGQSAVMRLDGWNWEDAVILESDGVHLNWPRAFSYKWTGSGIELEKNKNKEKQLEELHQFFTNAKAYSLKNEVKDVRLEAIQPIINNYTNLYIHANSAKDIVSSVKFAQQYSIKKIVIVGAKEADLVADFLLESNVSVMLNRVHSLPMYEDSEVLSSYEIAAKLANKGVKYCLSWSGDMEAMNSRNLPFGAGTSVAYGVPYEKAIQSISLSTAQILGIDQNYGSLEKGKNATLFISDGDALDMRTNHVINAFIDGKPIDLNNHQKELSEKYLLKYNINN